MTTFEPGASDVLTHGRVVRPRSTAFLANRPAASITEGFDVLVQLVMAAITTCPSSTSNAVPSASVTETARLARTGPTEASGWCAPVASRAGVEDASSLTAGGSLAGNDSADASSW